MNNAYQAGLLYELRAARYVRRRGYRLLNMRYRARDGEIDLIARAGEMCKRARGYFTNFARED